MKDGDARSNARVKTAAAALVALCITGAITWQATAQEGPAAAFADRIEVRALNIEAVVMNRDGQRIQGLSQDDFTLLVDGEEVPIEAFTEVREGSYVQAVERYPEITPGRPSGTSVLIFIDDFFVLPTDRDQVLRALR
jgi:hypothetical protein